MSIRGEVSGGKSSDFRSNYFEMSVRYLSKSKVSTCIPIPESRQNVSQFQIVLSRQSKIDSSFRDSLEFIALVIQKYFVISRFCKLCKEYFTTFGFCGTVCLDDIFTSLKCWVGRSTMMGWFYDIIETQFQVTSCFFFAHEWQSFLGNYFKD